MIRFDFAFYLTIAVIVTGLISFLNKLFWEKQRAAGQKESVVVEYARSFFPVLLVVWLLRSFVFQLYRVPTGSLEPTVIPGDLIYVNQFAYGLRLPVLHTLNRSAKIIPVGEPKTGQIALFYFPVNPKEILVKRVIGVPGDHVVYHNKVLTINGVRCKQTLVRRTYDYYSGLVPRPVNLMQENLLGHKHYIWVQPSGGQTQDIDVTVPPGRYFMMGDNRDDSYDSRGWGTAPESSFIGKAELVAFSWIPHNYQVRWQRIGTRL